AISAYRQRKVIRGGYRYDIGGLRRDVGHAGVAPARKPTITPERQNKPITPDHSHRVGDNFWIRALAEGVTPRLHSAGHMQCNIMTIARSNRDNVLVWVQGGRLERSGGAAPVYFNAIFLKCNALILSTRDCHHVAQRIRNIRLAISIHSPRHHYS